MVGLATRRKKAKNIRYLLLDVDGVLTDGAVYVNDYGVQHLGFCVYDGQGIRLLQQAGVGVGWISGRASQATRHRAQELGVEAIHQGIADKLAVYERILLTHGLRDAEVAYVGDDLPDLPVLKRVGLSAAPSNAVASIRAAVDWVTSHAGGRGAVREVIDLLLSTRSRPSGLPRRPGTQKRPL